MELPRVIQRRLIALNDEVTEASSTVLKAFGGTDNLDIAMPKQIGKRWCWAAVSISFQDFRKTGSKTLCSLVKETRNHTHDCCAVLPPLQDCDQEGTLADALPRVNVSFAPDGALTFSQVVTQIRDQHKPIGCFIDFNPPAIDHFVAIDGYVEATQELRVKDPQLGPLKISISDMLFNYNNKGGRWRKSFVVR